MNKNLFIRTLLALGCLSFQALMATKITITNSTNRNIELKYWTKKEILKAGQTTPKPITESNSISIFDKASSLEPVSETRLSAFDATADAVVAYSGVGLINFISNPKNLWGCVKINVNNQPPPSPCVR